MTDEERRSELMSVFAGCDEETRKIIAPMIEEMVFLEERMRYLRTLPMIHVNPKRPEMQRYTPASKEYKEASSSYMNGIRILCGILNKTEPSAQDELLKRLEEFNLTT